MIEYRDCEVCEENLPLHKFGYRKGVFSKTCKVCTESNRKKTRINQVKAQEQDKLDREWEDFYFYNI